MNDRQIEYLIRAIERVGDMLLWMMVFGALEAVGIVLLILVLWGGVRK